MSGLKRWRLAVGSAFVALWMTACGGGGGGQTTHNTASGGADATHGVLTLGLSGGASRDVDHVWVTVASVALHTQASQPWAAHDQTWTVLELATPVVLDLAAPRSAGQSNISSVLAQLTVPVGNYTQLRLFPLAHDAALNAAASAAGLSHNAQVDYTDAQGRARTVPLELPSPELGWRVAGAFAVVANTSSAMVVEADLQHSLVRVASADGVDRFTFRPALQSHDMATIPGILGALNPAQICGGNGALAAPNCADNIIVSAQRLSFDGQRHVSVRQYKVNSDGFFVLYPLPDTGAYDVVITGRRMQTMVIKSVPEWAWLSSASVPIQLALMPAASRTVNLASALQPAGSQLFFGQTVETGGKPYEVAVANVDPFGGVLASNLDLPDGPISVATYSSTASLAFTDTAPQEGSNAFSVVALGTSYDDAGAMSAQTPALGMSSQITVGNPVRKAGLTAGQIQVTLTGAVSSAYDAAQLVVSDVNGIVLAQAASSAGNVVLNVPAGAQAAALGGTAVYSVALRATGASGALHWARAASVVDLRSSTSAAVTLALP